MRLAPSASTIALCSTLVAALYAGSAAAQYTHVGMDCRAGTLNVLAKGDDLFIVGIEQRGILQSRSDKKLFDNWTQRCVGSVATIAGKRSGEGYCRNVEPATGDFVIVQWKQDEQRQGAGTYRYIHGTGKWKGISGGGTYEVAAPTRPVDENTYQNCINTKGTVLIPGLQ
jgi:hypothetical protein